MSWMKSFAVGSALAVAAMAAPASALTTFASTIALSNSNLRYVNSGSAADSALYTTSSAAATSASNSSIVFGVTNAVFGSLPLAATTSTFLLNASVPTITGLANGSAFNINGVTGSFSIIANAPVTIGSVTSSTLLTATFDNARLTGTVGSSAITLSAESDSGSLLFFSDFLDFSNVDDRAFTFTGSASSNLTAATGGRLGSFRSTVTGNFASNPPPSLTVPEPETWAMLVLGFGLVGVSVRRRRNVVLV